MPPEAEGAQPAPEPAAEPAAPAKPPEATKAAPLPAPAPGSVPAPVPAPAPTPEPPVLTLDEFVGDAVNAGASMELANAFHAEERAKPPRKATRDAWDADFTSFAGRPA